MSGPSELGEYRTVDNSLDAEAVTGDRQRTSDSEIPAEAPPLEPSCCPFFEMNAFRQYPWLMWFCLLLAGVLLTFGVPWQLLLESLLHWLDSIGQWGMLIMVLAFVLISFPFTFGYTPLALASGFLYGFAQGVLSVAIGSCVGSTVSFWCCRTLLRRGTLSNSIREHRVGMILYAMGESGWRGALLARMIPFPIGLANAVLAITSISFQRYIISTVVGLLPFQLMLVYFGTTIRSLSDIVSGKAHFGVLQTIMILLQAVLAIVSIFYFGYVAKKFQKNAETQLETEDGDVEAPTSPPSPLRRNTSTVELLVIENRTLTKD